MLQNLKYCGVNMIMASTRGQRLKIHAPLQISQNLKYGCVNMIKVSTRSQQQKINAPLHIYYKISSTVM